MEHIALRLACPRCHGVLDIRLEWQAMPANGLYLTLGRHRCSNCTRELILYGSRRDGKFVDFRLVDPSREWTMEEILLQEG